MKAILVIDIADDVAEAYEDFTVDYDLRGTPKDDQKVNESIKYVEDCPLKPIPSRSEFRDSDDETLKHYRQGRNDVIAELKGEIIQIFCEEIENA